MAAEYSANAAQVVPANSSVIFTESPVPCRRGLIYHRDDSGLFRLANRFFRQNVMLGWGRNTNYEVAFHANIFVPTEPAGTVEPISLAIAIDGEVDPSSIMTVTVPLVSDTTGDGDGDGRYSERRRSYDNYSRHTEKEQLMKELQQMQEKINKMQ